MLENLKKDLLIVNHYPRNFWFLGIGIILFIIFLGTLLLETGGVLTQFDPQATRLFQNFGQRSFDMPLSLLSLLGSFEITVLILAAIAVFVFRQKKKIYYALGFFFMILVFEFIGKLFLYHPGPPHDYFRYSLPFSFPTSYVQTNFSFPSGHMSRTIYLSVLGSGLAIYFLKNKKQVWAVSGLLFAFAILMFYSRVYLGEHWLSDVIGGLFLGSSFAFMTLAYL